MSHFLRTQAIYTYILQCHERNELPPTMREIAEACHLPLTTVFRHLDWLEARGYVSRDYTTRSLRLIRPLLTDEEHVYTRLIHYFEVSGLAVSINRLFQTTHLSPSRVKAALSSLKQDGRIQPDPDNPHMFYPAKTTK
jgi:DNA-binding IclR family transcriptional regulator